MVNTVKVEVSHKFGKVLRFQKCLMGGNGLVPKLFTHHCSEHFFSISENYNWSDLWVLIADNWNFGGMVEHEQPWNWYTYTRRKSETNGNSKVWIIWLNSTLKFNGRKNVFLPMCRYTSEHTIPSWTLICFTTKQLKISHSGFWEEKKGHSASSSLRC